MSEITTGSAICRSTTASRSQPRFWLLALALFTGALALESCGLFEPREAEEPEGNVRIILLSEPDSVYEQIRVGLQSRNISSYMNAYDQDDFRFHPDRADSIAVITELNDPTIYDFWVYDVESQVHTLILSANTELDVQFEECDLPDCSTTETVDLLNTDQFYTLTVDDQTYEGLVELTMARKSGEWRITLWLDSRKPGSGDDVLTWGVFRGVNR